LYSKYFFSSFKYKKKLLKKYFFLKKKKLIFNNYINERLFFLKKFFYFLFLYIENKNKNKCFINYKKKNKRLKTIQANKDDLIKGFLFVWSTKNNFFVTILDYTGNTLITRTGGNTGRTATRQRSTVFSADNAMYECCFLAKERGIQSLIVHIWSSLRIQQIKHCFEGLTVSGLLVESVVYWPLKSFGGCRLKKPRRV
jgi:ribosomal protein S11